jgi:hypothetical protein
MISAIASIALLVVAIMLRDEVRENRRKPVLELEHDPGTADVMRISAPRKELWVRFRVLNLDQRDVARRVQLTLLEAYAVHGDQRTQLNVPQRPFRATDMHDNALDVPGGVSRRFDIVHAAFEGGSAELSLDPRSRIGRDVLVPGTYELRVVVSADNADATYWKFEIEFLSESTGWETGRPVLNVVNLKKDAGRHA